jgi:hypothetical protein
MAEQIHVEAPRVVKQIPELLNDGITDYYVNGFTAGYSATEVHLILNEHGKDLCLVQLSFPTAKSLLNVINKILKSYEEKTQTIIPTLDELQSKIMLKIEE